MNLNQHLYLEEAEKQNLAELLTQTIRKEKIPENNIYIGGFSGGGNVSLLISDYLIKSDNQIKPKGVFIVDSPIDLLGLYRVSTKNLKLNFSESSVQESSWIINQFDTIFGSPSDGIKGYEKNSPYTFESENIDNLTGLKDLKIRFYTEPDINWWKEKKTMIIWT
jgi:predicted alpha/beta-fold hydrolase